MSGRLLALLIWALVAVSAAFWGLRLTAAASDNPPAAVVAGSDAAPRGDPQRIFGVDVVARKEEVTPEAELLARFKLVGLAAGAGTGQGRGVAVIAVDGRAPRPYGVGARVDKDLTLLAVGPRSISLGPQGGPQRVELQLPSLPPPATGVLEAAQPSP